MEDSFRIEKLAGLFFVLVLHGAFLYVAMSYKLIPPPEEAVTLMVSLINPIPKKQQPLPKPVEPLPPKKVALVKEKPILYPEPLPVLMAETSATQLVDNVVPAPRLEPLIEAPIVTDVVEPIQPIGPVTLSSELSLACPQRTPPSYPTVSRRMREHGRVVLHVELDEMGHITKVKIKESSGYKKLDEAGVAAIKTWQCDAAMRDGKAVPAVALQPFDFILN